MTAHHQPRNPSLEALEERWMPSTISGFVYHDLNGNGIQDAGENGLANVEVTLHNAQGQFIVATTTNSNGYYEFNHDPTIVVPPETQSFEVTFDGTTDYVKSGNVPQFNSSLGTLTSVEVIYEASIETQMKAENLDPVAAEIEHKVDGQFTLQIGSEGTLGTLQSTLNITQTRQAGAYDGAMDFAGASGVDSGPRTANDSKSLVLTAGQHDLSGFIGNGQVNLTNTANADACACGSGNLLAMVQTSSRGRARVVYTYTPATGLRPGDYLVREKTPSGFTDGYETQGNTSKIPNTVGTDELRITLTENNNSTQNNFGEVQQAAIGGFVYHDRNDNGLREGGEEGIAGVTMLLSGTDYAGNPVALSAITVADGSYRFENLLPGQYQIVEASQPPGFYNGRDTVGSVGGTVGADMITNINLPSAANGVEYNFGHYRGASISGFVYHDVNDNGLREGGEIGLAGTLIALTGTDRNGAPVYLTTTTGGDGSYRFDNLLPGLYRVQQVTQPAGYTDGKDTAGSVGGVAGNEVIDSITLVSESNGVEYNFGELLPPVTPPPPVVDPPPPIPITGGPFSKRMFLRW